MTSGLIQKLFNILIGFVSRKIFIMYLGIEYLGINGLFTEILSFLSLAELGIGSAITVYLYKPLAEHDEEKIGIYMQFYRKSYFVIGCVVLAIGLALIPFLPKMVNFEQNVEVNLYLVYLLFLANSVFSYWFFAYKTSLLEADQKGYVINNITTFFSSFASIAKCIIIIYFRKFELALSLELAIGIVKNIYIGKKADQRYPVICKGTKHRLDGTFANRMFCDVKGLVLHNIAVKLYSATDNIIISTIFGTTYVGLCDNYSMVINYIAVIVAMLTASLGAAIGNLNAEEGVERRYSVFRELDFANFWLCCFCSVCLGQLLTPFITLVFGNNLSVSDGIVFCIVINFFISTARNVADSFKASMGLLREGGHIALAGGIANVVLSVVLAKRIGLIGVFLATIITKFFSLFLMSGWFVLEKGFRMPSKLYMLELFKRTGIVCSLLATVKICCRSIPSTWGGLLIQGVVCIIIPNICIIAIYFRRKEFRQVLRRIMQICKIIKL